MIERHVYVRLTEEYRHGAALAELVSKSRALRALPQVLDLRILFPADDSAASKWDLCLVLRFSSLEEYAGFKSDQLHRSYVDEYLAPRAVVLKAWNLKE